MAPHLRHFLVREATRLEKDRVRDADLADVVEVPADADRHALPLVPAQHRGHSLGEHTQLTAMLARLQVAGLDRGRESQGDRIQDRAQVAVLQRLVAHLRGGESAPHLAEQLLAGEGLDQHSAGAFAEGLDCRVHGSVAGHDHDRQLGPACPQSLHERQAVHSRHVNVGDDDVERAVIEERDGGDGIAARDRLETLHLEQPAQDLQDDRLVVDAQDARSGIARVGRSQVPGHAATPARLAGLPSDASEQETVRGVGRILGGRIAGPVRDGPLHARHDDGTLEGRP